MNKTINASINILEIFNYDEKILISILMLHLKILNF